MTRRFNILCKFLSCKFHIQPITADMRQYLQTLLYVSCLRKLLKRGVHANGQYIYSTTVSGMLLTRIGVCHLVAIWVSVGNSDRSWVSHVTYPNLAYSNWAWSTVMSLIMLTRTSISLCTYEEVIRTSHPSPLPGNERLRWGSRALL